MGTEYCHKSRARIANICGRIPPPATGDLFFILHLRPRCNIVACEEKNGSSVRRIPSKYFPLLVHTQTTRLGKPPLLAGKTFPLLARK